MNLTHGILVAIVFDIIIGLIIVGVLI